MSKDIWGQLADTYEADHVYLSGADLVSAIKARVAQAVPDGEAVELGCGTGIYTAAYAPRCSRVIATDLSQRMVDRTRPALAAHPNVSVRVADAESTGLPGGSADGVVAVNLLHIVPNPEAIVAEAYRLLRPGASSLSPTPPVKDFLLCGWWPASGECFAGGDSRPTRRASGT